MNMLKLAAVLFAVAALGGLTLAVLHLKKKSLPYSLALLHGLMGAGGLAVLILGVMKIGFSGAPALALGIFLITALGGFFLFSFHVRKKSLPTPMVFIHGLAAVTAFVILLLAIFR
jgi:hypothetical protein